MAAGVRVMRRLLRRLAGPDPDTAARIDHLATVNALLIAELADARADLEHAVDRHARDADRYAVLLHEAYEPAGPDGACRKVRLRTRAEANDYARHVEQEVGAGQGAMKVYPCPKCPRHPVTVLEYWHIANARRSMRSGKPGVGRARKKQREALIRARREAGAEALQKQLAPEVVERLRGEAG